MTEYLDLEAPQTGKMPAFLKVLCILTFVGAGLGIIGALYSMLMQNFTLSMMERSQEMSGSNPFMMPVDNSAYIALMRKWGITVGFLHLIGSGLCLAGALMMWKLKKPGFYVYVLGQILPFIGMYGLMGGITPESGFLGGIMAFMKVMGIIFPLAFIVMYGEPEVPEVIKDKVFFCRILCASLIQGFSEK